MKVSIDSKLSNQRDHDGSKDLEKNGNQAVTHKQGIISYNPEEIKLVQQKSRNQFNLDRNLLIFNLRAQGLSIYEIGKRPDIDLTPPRVSSILRKYKKYFTEVDHE